jgi:transmembrane protein TMEM260 (protein O-mannosyltransferase)
MFAFSLTFWSQAVIAEVYAFQMLCTAAVLGCLLAWDARGERRWLFASALVYGLCCTHHGMSALLVPGLLYFALTSRYRRQFVRELPRALPLLLLPLCLYLYLPLAALRNPPSNWGDACNWPNFIAHVTGQQYHYLMFHLTRAQRWAHLRQYAGLGLTGSRGLLPIQFTPGFLWLAPLGAWSLSRRQPRLFGLTLLIYLVDIVYALNYWVIDVDVYYLPSHLIVALWIACGLRQAGVWLGLLWRKLALAPSRRTALNRACAGILLVMPLTLLYANWGLNDNREDWTALMYARAALATLKPNAVLLGEGDNEYFPVLYTRFVEKRRPDVTVLELNNAWSPWRLRLVTRLRAEGLRVEVPASFKRDHNRDYVDNSLLKRLVADNIRSRPVYVLAAPEFLHQAWLAEVLAPYHRVAATNLPSFELTYRPPQLAVAAPRPGREKRVRFTAFQRQGPAANKLQLTACDVEPRNAGGVPLLRMTYDWQINDPVVARRATVCVLFTDAMGEYQRNPDGSPAFENTHPLAYGAGQGLPGLPRTLRESFTLYVPPGEWNRRLHVRIAVALDGRLLTTSREGARWADVGEFRVTAPGEKPQRLAIARPWSTGDDGLDSFFAPHGGGSAPAGRECRSASSGA